MFNELNSLDTVEALMAFEEAFGVELPVHAAGDFGSPQEMVDWLELPLSAYNQHVRLLSSRALWWFALPKSTRLTGADIVYGIISLIDTKKGEGKSHVCVIDSMTMSAPVPE